MSDLHPLVLVDGPNLFNDVHRLLAAHVAEDHKTLATTYFKTWFDFDRLVQATVDSSEVGSYRYHGLGIVIFHSDRSLGRGFSRMNDTDLVRFWNRQAHAPGTSTLLVTVPGVQPSRSVRCDNCDAQVTVSPASEKGVDTSMVTYLYEAYREWGTAILFTNDADFVPPVLALRRRGKRVVVAARENAASDALRRACQTFYPLSESFLETDFRLFLALQPGAAVDLMIHGLESVHGASANDIAIGVGHGIAVGVRDADTHSGRQAEVRALPFPMSPFTRGGYSMLPFQNLATTTLKLAGSKSEEQMLTEGIRRHGRSVGEANWLKYFHDLGA